MFISATFCVLLYQQLASIFPFQDQGHRELFISVKSVSGIGYALLTQVNDNLHTMTCSLGGVIPCIFDAVIFRCLGGVVPRIFSGVVFWSLGVVAGSRIRGRGVVWRWSGVVRRVHWPTQRRGSHQ